LSYNSFHQSELENGKLATKYGRRWSWRLESLLLGFYAGMVFLEDFLWFVLNPHYGIKNFRKGKIWWHKPWWGPVPALYWFLLVIVIVLIYFGRAAI